MNWQNLNWADYTVLGIILFSTLISVLRGFIREALSLVVWILALWVAYKYSGEFAARFLNSISNGLRTPAAFVIIFIVILLIGAVINFFIGGVLYKTGLSGMDRLLGLVFGLARGVLLVAVLILVAEMTAAKDEDWWEKSQLIPQFDGLVVWLRGVLPKELEQWNPKAKEKEQEIEKTPPQEESSSTKNATTVRNQARLEAILQAPPS